MKNRRPEHFKFIATTFKGLEKVLEKELREAGASKTRRLIRAVEFYGDLPMLYKTNMQIATAIRILRPVAHLRNVKSVAALYNKMYEIPWEKFFHSRKRIYFHVSGTLDTIPDTRFVSQKTKDAVVDRFRDLYGNRPDVDKETPQVVINLHLFKNQISVSLDASGTPLFKRGYREVAGEAPLNEVLAAGLLRLARWRGDSHLYDPMTGSGTLPVEAALLAADIPPNLHREDFGFMHWHGFRPALLERVREELRNRIRQPSPLLRIIGSDRDKNMIDVARRNARKAGVDGWIEWEVKDFFDTRKIPGDVTLIFNPPYDKRLPLKSRQSFYEKTARHLQEAFRWSTAWIVSPENWQKYFRRKPVASYRLYNGPLPVVFSGFRLD